MGSLEDTEILVVGAGPTGLTLAAELLARGRRLRLVDKAPERSPLTRALAVHARTLELLMRFGIADELVSLGEKGLRLQPFVEGRALRPVELGGLELSGTPFPFVLFVSQTETERLLDRTVVQRGGTLERPVELVGLEVDGQGPLARLRGPGGHIEEVRARYVVGADGAHSAVRRALGLDFEGGTYTEDFLLADLRADGDLAHEQLSIFMGGPRLLVAFPLPGPNRYRFIAVRAPDLAGEGEPTLEDFRELVRHLVPGTVTLSEPTWVTRFRLHHRAVDRYRQGPIFVAGDAAHIHSPAGGQGMNTGIQDAFNLGWKLALVLEGRAPDTLLDTYHDERFPVGQRLLRRTDRLFSFNATSSRFWSRVRDRLAPIVFPFVMANPRRQTRALRFLTQLGIRYRKSRLSEDREAAAFVGGPRPGDRAPDGVPGFLGSLGRGFTLLTFGPPPEGIAAGPWLELLPVAAGARETYARYGIGERGWYLLRPDGYIASRGVTGSPHDWFRRQEIRL